jgi:hypothetical protein
VYAPQSGTHYTALSGTTLTLAADTTTHNAADQLLILYDTADQLPTGAATETTLAAANAKLPALASGRVPVDPSGVTSPTTNVVPAGTAEVATFTASGQTFTAAAANSQTFGYLLTMSTGAGEALNITYEIQRGSTWTAVQGVRLEPNSGGSSPVTVTASVGLGASSAAAIYVATYGQNIRVRSNATTTGSPTVTVQPISAPVPAVQPVLVAGNPQVGCLPLPASGTNADLLLAQLSSTASTNGAVINSTWGNVYYIHVANTSVSWRYLKLYKTSSLTVGTSTPFMTIPVAPGFAGQVYGIGLPLRFTGGLAWAVTTAYAASDTGAVGANEFFATLLHM